jgi:hypothetical protein
MEYTDYAILAIYGMRRREQFAGWLATQNVASAGRLEEIGWI